MRYFRYKSMNSTEDVALRKQYASLSEQEKRALCKEKVLNTTAIIVFFVVGIGCWGGFAFLIAQIPEAENPFLELLCAVGRVLLHIMAVIISITIGGIAAVPIWSKEQFHRRKREQEILSKACTQLRDYYEVQEPCLVTKCYASRDEKFRNHDVCIFIARGELRITVNLKHGFLHSKNDLGCYAFKPEEIALRQIQNEKYFATELKTADMEFLLGKRAKGFIENNFIKKNILNVEPAEREPYEK